MSGVRRRTSVLFGLLIAAASCGRKDSTTQPIAPTPTIDLTLTTTTLVLPQATESSVVSTVTRGGKYTGDVTITTENLPEGVTSTIYSTTSINITTTTITFTASATAQGIGVAAVKIRASGDGVPSVVKTVSMTVSEAPSYTMALTDGQIFIPQGTDGTVDVVISRLKLTSPVALAVEELPPGLTGVFTPTSIDDATSTLTLTVGPNVVPNDYVVTIRGTVPGLPDRTAQLRISVGVARSVTVSASPSNLSVVAGARVTTVVTVTRTNFTGPISFAALNLPDGVIAEFATVLVNPVSTVANLTLSSVTTASLGVSAITIRVAGTGIATKTTSISLKVTTNIFSVDFAKCAANDRAVWFALQDGDGATWTRVTGANDVYALSVLSARVGIAYAVRTPTTSNLNVLWLTRDELLAGFSPCIPSPVATRTVNGTFVHTANNAASASFGGTATFNSGDGAFSVAGAFTGTWDLLGFSGGARGYIKRNVTPTAAGFVGAIDFTGADSFDALNGIATVSHAPNEEIVGAERLYVGDSLLACTAMPVTPIKSASTGLDVLGIAPTKVLPTDFYQLFFQASTGSTEPVRSVAESFQTFSERVAIPFLLPSAMHIPVVSNASGGATYKRLTSIMDGVPAEYNVNAILKYSSGNASLRSVVLSATAAWRLSLFGVTSVLTTPDFSAVNGWNASWAPAASDIVTWTQDLNGSTGSACSVGARQVNATVGGTK